MMRLGWRVELMVGMVMVSAGMQAQGVFHATGLLPSYEVATAKLAGKDARGGITLMRYIQAAYDIPAKSDVRVVGGPAWLTTDEYVIQVKTGDAERALMQTMTSSQRSDETRRMQQSLLAERFKLKVHFEMREMQVFELVQAKGGTKLKEVQAPVQASGPVAMPPAEKFAAATLPSGVLAARVQRQTVELLGNTVPIRSLVNGLAGNPEIDGRPIVDKTGLGGVYTFTMKWAAPAGMGAEEALPGDESFPSLFTALQEELGLQLVPKKEPVEVVVIDQIDRPTEN